MDPDKALLCIRTTPVDSQIPSPAQILLGRKIQGNLPTKLQSSNPQKDQIYQRLADRQQKQKKAYDRSAKDLPPVIPGQDVRIQDPQSGRWTPATVTKSTPRSYLVQTPSGGILRRNSRHILDSAQPQRSNSKPATLCIVDNYSVLIQTCKIARNQIQRQLIQVKPQNSKYKLEANRLY